MRHFKSYFIYFFSFNLNRFVSYDIEFFENHNSGELISRINTDIVALKNSVGDNLLSFLKSSIKLIGSFIIMFFIDWETTLIILIIFPLISLLSSGFSRLLKKYTKEYQNLIADSSVLAEECFSSIKTVKSFVQEDQEIEHFKYILNSAYMASIKKSLSNGFYKCLLELMNYIGKNILIKNLIIFSSCACYSLDSRNKSFEW